MTIPTGGPAWTRSADFTTYGGHLEKANFQGEPVINPKTDVDAGHLQRLSADLAALTRVAPFCQMSFSAVAAGSAVTVHECRLMTGVTTAAYDGATPPAGFPGVTHVSAQVLAIEIGGLYSDDYSVSDIFEPAFASATCTSDTDPARAYTSGTSTVIVESGLTTGTFSVWIS